MIKIGKASSIRIVKWILNLIIYTGGTVTALSFILMTGVNVMAKTVNASTSLWPVRMFLSDNNFFRITMIDIHRSMDTQFSATVIPTRAILQTIGPKDFILIGFDYAWILLSYGTIVLIAVIMQKIIIHMESNDFFDQHTPLRLRMIGWTIIITSIAKSLLTYVYGLYTSSLISAIPSNLKSTVTNPQGKSVTLLTGPLIDISYDQIFIAVIIFTLAIAFQKGLDIKQELSLTV
jgi:hypothetical protein